jgi:Protein of unknown function (DUF3102)
MHGTDLNKLMNDLAAKANAAWRQSVTSVIDCGRILIEAKRKVGHGNWLKFVKKLEFSKRSSNRIAEMLIAIAEDPVLSNPKHVSNLPRAYSTLYRLTCLEQSDLEALLEDGTINSETERKDVDELIAQFNKRRLYEYDDMVLALATLKRFMKKWPELNDNLIGSIGNRLSEPSDIEDGAYLDDMPSLCAWLSKLHQACDEVDQRMQRDTERDSAESDWQPPKEEKEGKVKKVKLKSRR